ncbi:hypothetical protein AZOA_25130 [Azoarcus sp. Aa7]|nr:hypothetical protein [Azoarcus sp. Aa7]
MNTVDCMQGAGGSHPAISAKPVATAVQPDGIPAELKLCSQWLCWRYEWDGQRWTKRPYSPRSGARASVTDPVTWGTFDEAMAACHAGGYDGIGFVLTRDDPYSIIDLDNKPEHPATPEQLVRHQKIYETFNSYTELSVSGTGVHIVVRGAIPSGVHRDNVEVYSELRFMAFTGKVLRDMPIVDYQQWLLVLHGEMHSTESAELVDREGTMDDRELVDMAMNATNADKFNQLCRGEWETGEWPSQSEADFALLSIIGFYTDDNEQVRRIFRMTALGKREKATRDDKYLNRALAKIRAKQPAPVDATGLMTQAQAVANGGRGRSSVATQTTGAVTQVQLLRASDISAQAIDWLWLNWLAAGKLHILAGAPSTGKTTLAVSLAATVSAGGQWPDMQPAVAGNVLIWSGEDDIADTLVPRLMACGAKMERVFFVRDVMEAGQRRPFDPARDLAPLTAAAREIGGVRLVIVDSIVSAISGDAHRNNEVRRGLQPLVDFAEQHRAAILGISHFAKGTQGRDPVERVNGSLAFGALARLVFATVKVPDTDERIFVRTKSNLGPDGGGFNYAVQAVGLPDGIVSTRLVWGTPVSGEARDLIAVAESERDESGNAVDEWLRELLTEGGEMTKREIMRIGGECGFKERTIQYARERLGVQTKVSGFGTEKKSVWFLPPTPIHATNSPIQN